MFHKWLWTCCVLGSAGLVVFDLDKFLETTGKSRTFLGRKYCYVPIGFVEWSVFKEMPFVLSIGSKMIDKKKVTASLMKMSTTI